jgi:superfamily II DNA/RNA helicase
MASKVERLASSSLIDPIRVQIGRLGQASVDVTQNFVVLNNHSGKWNWLTERLEGFLTSTTSTTEKSGDGDGGGGCGSGTSSQGGKGGGGGGKVVVFVSKKDSAEELAKNLAKHWAQGIIGAAATGGGYAGGGFAARGFGGSGGGGAAAIGRGSAVGVACIHGNMDQFSRSEAVRDLKSGKASVLVATDVAARGLDIRGLEWVTLERMSAAKNSWKGGGGLTFDMVLGIDIREKRAKDRFQREGGWRD